MKTLATLAITGALTLTGCDTFSATIPQIQECGPQIDNSWANKMFENTIELLPSKEKLHYKNPKPTNQVYTIVNNPSGDYELQLLNEQGNICFRKKFDLSTEHYTSINFPARADLSKLIILGTQNCENFLEFVIPLNMRIRY